MVVFGSIMIVSFLAAVLLPVWLFIKVIKWFRLPGNYSPRLFILMWNIILCCSYSFYFYWEIDHYYFYSDVAVLDIGQLALAVFWMIVLDLHMVIFLAFIYNSIGSRSQSDENLK